MNAVLELLNHPFAQRLGWALLHSLWQGALVAALFAMARSALRRASANARYLAGCFSLLLLVVLLMGTWVLMATAVDRTTGSGRAAILGTGSSAIPSEVPVASSPVHNSRRFFLWSVESLERMNGWLAARWPLLERLNPWLVAAWFFGVALFSSRLLHGCWRVKSMKTEGIAALDAFWNEMLIDLKRRLDVSRPVRLLKSVVVEVPAVVGWLRPVVLLPASMITGLSRAQLEAVIAHELAHIRRHDYLVNAIQNAVETLMFYHPAVWWISRCIREERELCCDDLVVKVCGDRVIYARALATMEELRALTPRLALAASDGSLLNRIRRLLGLPIGEGRSRRRQAVGFALLGIGLGLVILGVCLMLAPPQYRATARIEIEKVPQRESGDRDGDFALEPQSTLEEVQSPAVLNRVIETLGLGEVWGKRYRSEHPLTVEEALALLRQRTRIEPVRDTRWLNIRVSSDNAAEAAEIANGIAQSYKDHQQKRTMELFRAGVKALEERLTVQDVKVRAAQEKVDQLRRELNIFDPNHDSVMPSPVLSPEIIRQLQQTQNQLNDGVSYQETQLRKLQELDRAKLREAIQTALDTPDSHLASLLTELAVLKGGLLAAKKDFRSDHPTIVNIEKAIEEQNIAIEQKLDGILIGLATKLDATRARLAHLDQRLHLAKTNDLAMAERSRPYYAAKMELAQLLQFKTVLGMKIASTQTEAMLPRHSRVTVLDLARAPARKAAPNHALAAAIIVLGMLLKVVGFITLNRNGRPPVTAAPT